jgi:hypothetical protein
MAVTTWLTWCWSESRTGSATTGSPRPRPRRSSRLRDQAPELYDLWLKIAQEKASTANYVDRAPYEVPERLAQSGRPRALGALIVVLSFCGYLAWLGGPGPYIGGLIAILDLVAMLGVFFGLRPDRLADPRRPARKPLVPAFPGGPAWRDTPLGAYSDQVLMSLWRDCPEAVKARGI